MDRDRTGGVVEPPRRVAPRGGSGALALAVSVLSGFALCVSALGASDALAQDRAEPEPTVILISLDGTRPRDIGSNVLPSLDSLTVRGAVARYLVPVNPTNTFPNHVSLVTGVRPERHGIVDNRFTDPERGEFERADIPSWIEVEPLWSWLEARGVRTAAYYWVGSEGVWPGGRAPTHWKPFSPKTREDEKVEQILAWLDLPADAGRPRFITSWFRGADHAGHAGGPGAGPARDQLNEQEPAVRALLDGIEARGLWPSTTLLVVSDHGMVRVRQWVELETEIERTGIPVTVRGIGGFATVELVGEFEDREAAIERVLALVRLFGLEAERPARAPTDWHVAHRRFGDIAVRAPVGLAIVTPGLSLSGYHGYAAEEESMRAIFYAMGRGVPPKTRLPDLHNLDVAPTVLALLGFAPPGWMEGRPIATIVPQRSSAATPSATLVPIGGSARDRAHTPDGARGRVDVE